MALWFGARRHPEWRVLGLALTGGAVAGFGQAPFGFWLLTLAALAGLIALAAREMPSAHRAWIGFAAGFGYALVTMNWIVEPFFVEAEVYAWMAPFALVLMCAGMGVFWGLALWLGGMSRAGRGSRAFGVAIGLAASDALRSYVFTGFPWVLLGHIWIDTPLAQAAALIGPIGLSLLTVLLAALPALFRARPVSGGGAAAALLAASGALWLQGQSALDAPLPESTDPAVIRIVQPNAAQHLKWQPDYAREFFYRHLDLTAAPPEAGKRPDLVIWPETAVPFLLDDSPRGLEVIAEAAGGVPVALGIQRAEGARFFNSLAVIAPDGTVSALYDKTHLVPFGEYIPFGDALSGVGISAFAAQAGNGYSSGSGEALLDLGPLGRVVPLICYEAVFPQDIRAIAARGDWLLQITNDAWFGDGAGPEQHLVQARFRAIEQGLPLMRSANTGISAAVDPRGRVTASLGMGAQGVIDVPLPVALPKTTYARLGDWPVIGLIVAILVFNSLFYSSLVDRRRFRH
ncbi:apolipoprotein N-acyltransferase [Thioclava sp. A2]|uniref:apolipoprotein N-acyltransferase n=1 Tax=Thioclava sp. FCG-A2 TaxID=3080562 RepID=UPI0029542BC0|nr:apolipoprotein N-acyltransferase [Thioclava sp. A2]MDV7272278.1 apolipoprotein N-acyltransferase [Thioclava sp. A2]